MSNNLLQGARQLPLRHISIRAPWNIQNFYISEYQICEKWLKDRRERELSTEDIVHYGKVVVSLKETIRLMGEVDGVIESAGGWPVK